MPLPPKQPHRPLHLRGRNPPNPAQAGSIVFATLNVKGANSVATQDKWKTIIRSMLSKRIAVLSVLESHSDDEQIRKLNSQYYPNLQFAHSHDTLNPRSKGIILVTNKNKTNCTPTNLKINTPGRTLSFNLNWPANNTPNENAEFWHNILTKIENGDSPPQTSYLGLQHG